MTQLAQCPSLQKIFSSRGRLSLWDMLEKLNSDEVIRPIAYLSSIGRKLTLFRHQMAQVGAVTVSLTAEELQHTKQAADRLLAVAHGLDMHAAIAA